MDVTGGAKLEEVKVEENKPEIKTDATVRIITTAVGTFGKNGLVPVGTRAEIDIAAYSDVWMKPATKAEGAKIAKYREAKGE